jgi:TRAP-type mannitol/chloroaromatic compound transport system permease small subunit
MSAARVARAIDSVIAAIGQAVAWLVVVMLLTDLAVVAMRYGFDTIFTWLQELMTYLHAAVFLIGAVHIIQADGHVRVNILYNRMPPAAQAWIDIVTMVAVVMPVAVLLHWTSHHYVLNSWAMLEGSPHSGGLDAIFILKTYIWVFADLLFLAAVARALHRIAELRGTHDLPTGEAAAQHETGL